MVDDDALDTATVPLQGGVDDAFELDILAFTIGDIAREDETRARGLHAVGEGLRTKACKYHDVNRAKAYDGEHEHDGLGAGRHVDGDAIAFLNAHAAQGRRQPLHFMQHLRIGEGLSLAALVDVDQGRMPTPAALDVIVE